MTRFRSVCFYRDYFESFFNAQSQKVRDKIIWTLDLIEEVQRVPESYLKHVESTEGLFEIRIQLANDIFRIFCFFDKDRLVVLANEWEYEHEKEQSHDPGTV